MQEKLRWFMVFRLGLVFVLSLSVSPARAENCLGARDVATGIALIYADGARVEVRALDSGLVQIRERGMGADGGDLQFFSRYGIYDVEAAALVDGRVSDDRRVTYDYGDALLTEPKTGAVGWTGVISGTFPDGFVDHATAAFVFGPEQDIAFAACRYRAVTVDATFLREDGWEGQQFLYFADLGFAALVGRSRPDTGKQRFELADIEAANG